MRLASLGFLVRLFTVGGFALVTACEDPPEVDQPPVGSGGDGDGTSGQPGTSGMATETGTDTMVTSTGTGTGTTGGLSATGGSSTTDGTSTDGGTSGDATGTTAGSTGAATDGTTGSATGPGATTGGGTDGTTGGTTGGEMGNCGNEICRGHEVCIPAMNGAPIQCACDEGYYPNPVGDGCLLDTECVQLRPLQRESCRTSFDGHAVAAFFAVDYCGGAPVPTAELGDLGDAFQVFEGGVDIAENVESSATVIDKDVESYVAIALDMSDSLRMNEDLPALIDEIQDFVTSLEPGPDEAPVHVSLIIFGQTVAQMVPFTPDLTAVTGALGQLGSDPSVAEALVGGMGTDLYEAVERGIHETDRMREFREIVTGDGVLSIGTVLVITDGNDESGGALDEILLTNTLNRVISVGVSLDVEGGDLQTIGRDGSYLAPDPADWTTAFAEITERVDKYPESAYLLAYCSSKTTGSHTVEVTLADPLSAQTNASCDFNADLFSAVPQRCDLEFFTSDCDGLECGGFTACGACANDQCCVDDTCQAPTSDTVDCFGDDSLCTPAGKVCGTDEDELTPDVCVDPVPLDGECNGLDLRCMPGMALCVDGTCMAAALPDGEECSSHLECASLHCAKTKVTNPLDPQICQPGEPGARLYRPCDATSECEAGAYCDEGTCQPRLPGLAECLGPDMVIGECAYGPCVDEGAGPRCDDQGGSCWITWGQKTGG